MEIPEDYTNSELARDYYRIVTLSGGNFTTYNAISRIIKDYEIDLPEHYRKNKRLPENIPKLGEGTAKILEAILSQGVDEAIKTFIQEHFKPVGPERQTITLRKRVQGRILPAKNHD